MLDVFLGWTSTWGRWQRRRNTPSRGVPLKFPLKAERWPFKLSPEELEKTKFLIGGKIYKIW